MSIYSDVIITMNLHEECLLKYLTNPLDLFVSTEALKSNNELIKKEFKAGKFLVKKGEINYTGI